ncbi:hypothetical protein CORC01_07612 [Colletotrichum orchidophilum]|uniref:Uncharacterized protein n=1 Tax=Colletotrichum orchidophilum TaxID=1209926 RepID=A0A1G4B6X6_9PEZI|nr:uncharacterized protein CORC01_07612 [Colletotrichum orchidophilum]OHE97171.1 hypothetical protein CORC01_07612 [Colletotrichum orchidophilum]
MNLSEIAKLFLIVISISHGGAASAKAEFQAPTLIVGSILDHNRISRSIDRPLLAEGFKKIIQLTDPGALFHRKSQESLKGRDKISVAGLSIMKPGTGDEVDKEKTRADLTKRQLSPGSIQGRSASEAFPWKGLNPDGSYLWTRTVVCMAICERNTYHMRETLRGKGRLQSCFLKCKSDGSMTDITGEVYQESFRDDFAPVRYYQGYLDYIMGKIGVHPNRFPEWRQSY